MVQPCRSMPSPARRFGSVVRPCLLAAGLALLLAGGCGGTLGSAVSSTQLATASITNFGDSITCGFYASPANGSGFIYSTNGYAGLFDAAVAAPAQNLCRGGDQASDMARLWVYPNTAPALGAGQLYTVMVGTNDADFCGASAGCQTNYTSSLLASLAWLGLPAKDKTLASAMQQVGAWTADPVFPTALVATGPGASLRFPVQQTVAGRSLYLIYRVSDESASVAGAATVTVDGTAVASLETNPHSGHAVLTFNGTPDTLFAVRVPLGAVGAHTVSLTTTSEASATFTVLWAGVCSGMYDTVLGAPHVLAGGVPAGTAPTLVANGPIYTALAAQIVEELAAEGFAVRMAATATALDTATDLQPDGVHPSTSGHAKLATAFEAALF